MGAHRGGGPSGKAFRRCEGHRSAGLPRWRSQPCCERRGQQAFGRLAGRFASLFGRRVVAVYWVERLVGKGVRKERLPGEVFLDILFAAITLPLAEFDLSMPFCTRVGSDSSTTGLGRSWTLMLSDLVERCCRQSDRKRIYTNLSLDGGVEVSEGRCELEEVDIQPEDFK